MSFRAHISLGFLLILLLLAGSIQLALNLPFTAAEFAADGDGLLLLEEDGARPVVGFRTPERLIEARASLLIEEPDVLPDYASYNALLQDLGDLARAAAAGELTLLFADREQPLSVQPRRLGDLPALFWLQIFCGAAALAISILVWSARPAELNTCLFAATGVGYILSVAAAAIYSTRELMIDGNLFLVLSWVNYAGALLFAASLTGLFWNMPLRLAGPWLLLLAYLVAGGLWLGHVLQWYHAPTMLYASILVLFIPGIAGSILQWLRTRQRPGDRAALRWLLLSIYAGTLFYTFLMILPVLLGLPAPASQGLLLTTFLLMYAGIALGVVRYRLFQLERWWFHIWSWFLSGVAIILLDLLLVSVLTLSGPVTLGIAVAVVGWLYFPMRQWVWARWVLKRQGPLDEWLDKALPHLIGVREEERLAAALQRTLQAVLAPLHIQPGAGSLATAEIRDNGATLAVPIPDRQQHLLLLHAQEGRRLFTPWDLRNVERILALYTLVQQAIRAETAGARGERERIRRDIHDDLGAKLLTLLHRSDPPQQTLVREAIQDLRDLLGTLESEAMPLQAALAQWQAECSGRCLDAGVTLDWQQQLEDGPDLPPRSFLHLTRVLREAVSNALRHAQPSRLTILIEPGAGGSLAITVANDGQLPAFDTWQPARGCQIMRQRVEGLGGQVNWQRQQDLWQVRWEVPLLDQTLLAPAAG